ncbi:MAG: hypothetical protein V4692_04505 [Bdellovibrionota bacterium]
MNKFSFAFAIAAAGFVFVATGCVSMNTQLPLSRLETPESNGSERPIRLATGATAIYDLEVTNDASARPLTTNSPRLTENMTAMFLGQFGVIDNLDFGVRTTLGEVAPVMLTGKFQMIGDSASAAKQGNFSLALTGAVGYWQSKKSGEQKGRFGPGGFPWSGEVRVRNLDTALIMGYRIRDNFLLYSGGFYTDYSIDLMIDHAVSSDASSPAATYSLDYSGFQKGANLGVSLDFNAFVHMVLEVVYADVYFPNGLAHAARSAGANVAFQF